MGVYESQRGDSALDFYHRAVEIRAKVTRLVQRDKVIPKSGRFVFSVPMAETARQMVYHIVTGMEFYPSNDERAEARRRYYTLAIADAKMLQEDMKCIIEVTGNVRPSTFSELTDLLDEEIKDLKSRRKNVKVRRQSDSAE